MKLLPRIGQFLLPPLLFVGGAQAQIPAAGDDALIARLDLQQKAELLIGTGMEFPEAMQKLRPDPLKDYPNPVYVDMVMRIRGYLPGAAGGTAEFPELGITTQVLADGPAGLRIAPRRAGEERTYYCTAFPIATLLASTWDTALVRAVGGAMGNEVKEYGADILLAPALNLQRDPLCGRNFEYYSEDPLVAGKLAAAFTQGVQSNGVGTSLKHFAANNSETNRMTVDTLVSERALREIYLKGFEIAIKEGRPWTVMSSYNKINGVYTSESSDLLTKILRQDWGFGGYVMSDWGGGTDLIAQMKAGNDLIMPGEPKKIQELVTAVRNGQLEEKVLDRNLARLLKIMRQTPRFSRYAASNAPDLTAHAQVARQAASDGMVLLKNAGSTLPIAAGVRSVAAFGNAACDFISGGTGSGDVHEAYTVSLLEGLTNAGYTPDAGLADLYRSFIQDMRAKQGPPKNFFAAMMGARDPIAEMPLPSGWAQTMAEKTDLALIALGRNAGEGADRTDTAGDFRLSPTEQALLREVTEAFHARGKKVVVILNIAGVIETASWRDLPDAILVTWLPGQEGGNAVVDVLSGKVNPSGRVAVTFPLAYADAPTARNFPGVPAAGSAAAEPAGEQPGFPLARRVPWEIAYEEDIYVGYRYYNTFHVPVAYEFGFGLSYTRFDYQPLQLTSPDAAGGRLDFSVEVKNTGPVAGREVVQVYVSSPTGKLTKPESTLVAFAKTKLLQPGESETLRFRIEASDFASFDETDSAWIAEAGDYTLEIGASSRIIRQTAGFRLSQTLTVAHVSKALSPTREIKRLEPK